MISGIIYPYKKKCGHRYAYRRGKTTRRDRERRVSRQPCWHLDLGFLVSGTVRKIKLYCFIHWVCDNCYGALANYQNSRLTIKLYTIIKTVCYWSKKRQEDQQNRLKSPERHTQMRSIYLWQRKWKWSRSVVSNSLQPLDGSLPGSAIHGIFQARILEWAAIFFSRGSSQPRDRTQVSCVADWHFTIWATREATWVQSLGWEHPHSSILA